MRIQHNITALSAANRLKSNESTVSKNIQKLSSGYRINSAADDAAGLAVSEKMRKQINGLSQAEDNTKNGISLIQTAEGGLNETSSILQRMNTLAVESSNGTYKDADRANLQKELDHLNTEIDRISTSTKFNEISLLDGSLSASASQVTVDPTLTANVKATTATKGKKSFTVSALDADGTAASTTYSITTADKNGTKTTHTIELNLAKDGAKAFTYKLDGGTAVTATADAAGKTATAGEVGDALKEAIGAADWGKDFSVTNTSGKISLEAVTAGTSATRLDSVAYVTTDKDNTNAIGTLGVTTDRVAVDSVKTLAVASQAIDGTNDTAVNAQSKVFTVGGRKFAFATKGTESAAQASVGKDVDVISYDGSNIATSIADAVKEINKVVGKDVVYQVTSNTDGTPNAAGAALAFGVAGSTSSDGTALTFQVGAENIDDQRASLSVANMDSTSLGTKAIDISSQSGAQQAIDLISKAVATVSTTRADLGALQNELEHTSNNLSTMTENLTSAESTIRDVDMTDEYVQFSKNQILAQAANSMLAQANAQPQNVLSLLKG